MAKIDWSGLTIGEKIDRWIYLNPEFFSDLENYNKGENRMNNEIEDFVDIRAKLEQLTEECGELAAACMKLIRAIGNGNPCNVTEEQAISKVLEEWSDVEIAAVFMLKMLEDRCGYDIYDRIDQIGAEKTARWQKRVQEALHGKSDEGMDGSSCSDSDSCDI